MIRIVLFSVLIALPASGPAKAQDRAGYWHGSGSGNLTVELIHIEDERYNISITTVVPMQDDLPGCGGGVSGEVVLQSSGGTLAVKNEFYEQDNPTSGKPFCEIALSFDGGNGLVLTEKGDCMDYHGAACGFSGTLQHEGAGI